MVCRTLPRKRVNKALAAVAGKQPADLQEEHGAHGECYGRITKASQGKGIDRGVEKWI